MVLVGLFLGLAGLGAFSALTASMAQAQQKNQIITNSKDPLVPNGFDCSKIHELGIDKQMNLRAQAIMIACAKAAGGGAHATSPDSPLGALTQFVKKLLSPLAYGGTDVDLINGTDSVQSTTFSWGNPDNPNQIVVAYNDSRGRNVTPINISGASVSTDGGNTFVRLTAANGQSPFTGTEGDPVALYNKPTGTWFTVWLDTGCGSQGLGGYKSTTPSDPSPASWTHFCIHTGSADDRESGWTDMNPSSPYYGRMYVSWNDFARGGGNIFVRYSTDNGNTWTDERQINSGGPFIRNAQITGDLATGNVYIAGINEGGGGFPHNCNNLFYKSTDGGNSWTNTYTGPTFSGPGRCAVGYFADMYCNPDPAWRYEGWGEPAAYNGVVHYVYSARNSGNGDPSDVFYIRSTDGGVTFSAPFQLNSNTDPLKAQWEPNLSVSPSGTLFAVWYDERDGGGVSTCIAGSNSPCYRMYARRSNDNGVTWLPDDAFSDVVSPLPAQPAGSDYDYASALATRHLSSWVDGRVPINGTYQADTFTDGEPVAQAPMAQSAFSRKTHGAAGTFDIPLPLNGNAGIECRSGGATNDYQMIIDFPSSVTVGSASVTSGNGSVSGSSGSGTSQITVNLTGVTNVQTITVTLSNVNDGTHMGDVPVSMGVLVGDVNGNAAVNASDVAQTKSRSGQTVDPTTFRSDVNANGSINATDVSLVKSSIGIGLP
jgi:hypothetical protein